MKILLATDGSEFSIEATRRLGEIITTDEETFIRIINSVEIIAPPVAPFSKERYLEEEKASQNAAVRTVNEARLILRKALGKRAADIETKTIDGEAKKVILNEAEEWGADLIVVGSHGHGFWNRLMLGSVSDAIVRYADCSVLVVRR